MMSRKTEEGEKDLGGERGPRRRRRRRRTEKVKDEEDE